MTIARLFDNNETWVGARTRGDPDYFHRLARQQAPDFLWIGCSDSRVPANDIVGLDPGELFVHRNVANLVVPSDMNLLSVLQYAVEILRVSHVIVCGHYGCGGVRAALGRTELGLIDNWLQPLKQLTLDHRAELEALDQAARVDRLCELNVAAQVRNVAATSIIQDAWARDQAVAVHGWIYALEDGHLRDLDCSHSRVEDLAAPFRFERAPAPGPAGGGSS